MTAKSGWVKLTDEERGQRAEENRARRMNRIDAMPKDIRSLIHVYGFTVVDALMALGVSKPNQIRHVVETVLDEFSPTRGAYSRQGLRTEVAPSEKQKR